MTGETFSTSPLVSLNDLEGCKPEIVGAKANSLSKMLNSGIAIPPGFVLTSQVFDRYANQTIPDDLAEIILQQFDSLNLRKVAVRSSSLVRNSDSGEDSKEHSWAGIFETYLNVAREDLINKIQGCWRSVQRPEVLEYMRSADVHPNQVSMAVIVQEMIDGDTAGVVDSINYDNPQFMLIEAVSGMGEALVQGDVTPDEYYIERDLESIAAKSIKVQEKELYAGQEGLEERKPESGEKQKLTDQDILKLFGQVHSLETEFGYPVDVEWVKKLGQIYITQARPLTNLGNRQVNPDQIFKSLLSPTSWAKRVTRPWNLFRTSLICNATNSSSLRQHGIELTDFLNIEESVVSTNDKKLHHFWEHQQRDRFFEGLAQFVDSYPILLRDFLRLAPEYNQRAQNALDNPDKEFKTLEGAMDFMYALAVFGTIIPITFLEAVQHSTDSEKHQQLMDYCEHLREASYHPIFTDRVIAPLAIQRIQDLGLPGDYFEYLTANEILDENVGSVEYRLRARANRQNFVYEYLNGREIVVWLDDIQSFIRDLDQSLILDAPEKVNELQGVSGYPGYVEGLARLVLTYDVTSVDMQRGNIIVTINGNPNIIRLMELSGGIVSDEGGRTSHIVRLARELKKPCVVGTRHATSLIRNNDFLVVDGDKGHVQIRRDNG